MEYSKTYIAKEEHIDVQGIMDGLYYPFYMEWCRHDFIREVLGFDFETEARNGVYMVLTNYSLNFIRSLKKGDEFSVTCDVFKDKGGLPKLHFKQAILLNKKVVTKAVFSGTCVPATGGRPYLPDLVFDKLRNASELEVMQMI
jgi:acyl-CoA thioester hydrolase